MARKVIWNESAWKDFEAWGQLIDTRQIEQAMEKKYFVISSKVVNGQVKWVRA